jgi:carbon monoxide dehydrogenase subunit G
MARQVNSIVIERPIEEVFAVATDVTKTGRWFPGEVEEFWITPPPHGVGSVRRAVVKMMGQRTENDATVTEFDPPRHGVLAGERGGLRWTGVVDCTPVEGGTRLDFTFEANASGAARLILGTFMGWYRKSWDTGLANLKRMMEAGEL